MGDGDNRWQRAAGERGMAAWERRGGGGKAGSTGCFRRVPFELIKVRVAASADESLTLALDPSPAV